MTQIRRRPSLALIVGLLALVVAMGGTTYAAVKLPKNSVGSQQVKNGSLKAKDLRKGAADPSVVVLGASPVLVPITAVINAPTLTTVRTMNLPKGEYYVEASVFVVNLSAGQPAEPRCFLRSSGATLAGGTTGFFQPIQPDAGTNVERAQFQLDAAFSLASAGTVRVECNKNQAIQNMEGGASMSALRVGSAKAP